MPDSNLIEERFKDSIDRYVKTGCHPGSFIVAVLENNLVEAIGRGDIDAIANLPHILCYCYNKIPLGCWGSKEKVQKWYEEINNPIEL